jgi:hypothetical protein
VKYATQLLLLSATVFLFSANLFADECVIDMTKMYETAGIIRDVVPSNKEAATAYFNTRLLNKIYGCIKNGKTISAATAELAIQIMEAAERKAEQRLTADHYDFVILAQDPNLTPNERHNYEKAEAARARWAVELGNITKLKVFQIRRAITKK